MIRPGKPCAGHVRKWIAIGSATFRVSEDRTSVWSMFFHFNPRQLLADVNSSSNLHISLLVPAAAEPPRVWVDVEDEPDHAFARHASALDLRLRRDHSVLVHQDLRAARWRSRTPASRTSSLRYRIKRKPSTVTTARCKTASTIARGRRPAWIGSTRRCQPPDGHRDLPSWASTP